MTDRHTTAGPPTRGVEPYPCPRAGTAASRLVLLFGGLVCCGFASSAAAQSVSVDHYAPLPQSDSIFGLSRGTSPGHLRVSAGLAMDYTNDALVGRDGNGELVRVLAHRATMDIGVGLGIYDRAEFGISLPIHLIQISGAPDVAEQLSGIGNLRVLSRLALYDGPIASVGLALEWWAPTAQEPLMGDSGHIVHPELILDVRAGPVALVLNAGVQVRSERVTLFDLTLDHAVTLGLGADIALPVDGVAVQLAATTTINLAPVLDDGELTARDVPVELLAGIRGTLPAGFGLGAGVGLGLTEGFGAPDLRAMLSLGWTWPPPQTAEPLAVDARPPVDAERLPLAALDEPLADSADERLASLLAAANSDEDPDADGLLPPQDACPTEAEDMDGFEDADGCPEPDNDQDGVLDAADRCPTEKETPNGIDDEDGCPDEGQGAVVVSGGQVKLNQRVVFRTGSDDLRPSSRTLLGQVAKVLNAHPSIDRIRIEGHTDRQGDPEKNVDLSERRARRVMAFLISRGVAPARLTAKGFGSSQPLNAGRNGRERAENRRVVFQILSREDQR